jgi:hypothetical protein
METRYGDRKPTTGTVTLCCEDLVRAGTILDVSVPGCHLATRLPLHKGQSLCMDVYLSNTPPMRIDLGVVRWAADGEAGIEFIRMPEEDAIRLRWYAGQVEKDRTRGDVERVASTGLGALVL